MQVGPMLSAMQLEARIVQLDAEIEAQQEVLQRLENSKCATQRQLNNIRDPVARLPLEISSEIFLQCRPSSPTPDAHTAPMLLLRICSTWTDIALATPAVWATIHLDDHPSDRLLAVLQHWLKRARHSPVSISLHESLHDAVAIALGAHAKQIKRLALYQQHHYFSRLTPFPCLETLTIAARWKGSSNTFSLGTMMELLHLTPNVAQCIFEDIHISVDSHASNNAQISFFRISRSSPPLRKLVLNRGSNNGVRLGELLRDAKLFAALADSSLLLPNLRILKIRCPSLKDNELLHETQPRPNADVCNALRLVASDGMEIYIGDENDNYISL
ncbi:hypothetical protein K438DRAFT_1805997 [Mycena galopus ATCC 62051]|nr:hypothetical protein K438DRAFT_1805997 [Mycena galopus ATCC 62051]